MKKIILLISILSINIFATEYKVEINNASYKSAVLVAPYVPENLTCEDPLVLNEEQTACETLTCVDPLVLNDAEDTCIDPIAAVGWIITSQDTCNGMRQANFNPNVYFSRANTNIRNMNLEIPKGYHWVSKSEYATLFNESTVSNKSDNIRNYRYQCGLGANYPRSVGINQIGILFKDDPNGMHSSHYEHYGINTNNNTYNYPDNFLGYVLYKD
jgi:hypothetical protein